MAACDNATITQPEVISQDQSQILLHCTTGDMQLPKKTLQLLTQRKLMTSCPTSCVLIVSGRHREMADV